MRSITDWRCSKPPQATLPVSVLDGEDRSSLLRRLILTFVHISEGLCFVLCLLVENGPTHRILRMLGVQRERKKERKDFAILYHPVPFPFHLFQPVPAKSDVVVGVAVDFDKRQIFFATSLWPGWIVALLHLWE